jgi:PRC-barrel domain
MNKFIVASAAAALMFGASATAFAQASAEDCQSMFQRADVNKDGSLQADEAKVFLDAMNQAQVKPQDASLVKQDEFMAACQKNAFVNIDPATIGVAATDSGTTTTGQGTATTDQSAAGTTTTEQPAATTEQSATGTTATTDQSATTTTTDQSATGTTATTDQTASTDTTAAGQQEQALAAPSGLLASNLIGTTVYSQDDQSIGDINDIILSQEGQATQVIVGVGGFLGMGEKDVVLDMSKLQIAATDDGNVKVVTQTSQEELKNLPAFAKPDQPAQQQDQQQQQQ